MSCKILNKLQGINQKSGGDARYCHKMRSVVNENCLRIALIVFNFIFSILSISLIALALVYSNQLSNVELYTGGDFLKFPTILLIVGCLSFLMSIAGCYGAKSRSRYFFIVFILVLICLLVLELTVSVIAFVNIDSEMANRTRPIMIDQVTSNDTIDKENFHLVEAQVSCCGIDGPEDYLNGTWFDNDKGCCGFVNCMEELEDNYSHIWFKYGCATVVAEETQIIAKEAAAIGTICAFLQIFEIGCALFIQTVT